LRRVGGAAYHREGAPAKPGLLGRGLSVSPPKVTDISTNLNRSGIPIRSRFLPVHSDFDLDGAFFSGGVVTKTTPLPILRLLHQITLDRVAVYVSQFLNPLLCGVHVEVVITRLPEVFLVANQSPCHRLLQRLSATASVPRSGSLSSRCTCSGMTT